MSIATHVAAASPVRATLGALWTYGNGENLQLVIDDSTEVSLLGEDRTVFRLANSNEWPQGDYSVEVFLDGNSVSTNTFSVR